LKLQKSWKSFHHTITKSSVYKYNVDKGKRNGKYRQSASQVCTQYNCQNEKSSLKQHIHIASSFWCLKILVQIVHLFQLLLIQQLQPCTALVQVTFPDKQSIITREY